MAADPISSAETMTSEHVPEGMAPEAFLRDADLLGYRERELAKIEPGAPGHLEAVQALKQARMAAALTELSAQAAEEESRAKEAAAAAEAEAFEAMSPKDQETEVLRKFRESRKDAS